MLLAELQFILPYTKKIVDWRLRKRIEAIEVQPDPRIGELEQTLEERTDERDELSRQIEQSQREIEKLQQAHSDVLDGLNQRHQKVMHDIKYEHSKNMEKQEEDYLKKLADLKVQHSEMIERDQIEFDRIGKDLKLSYEKAIRTINDKHDEEMIKAKETYLREKSILEVQYAITIAKLNAGFEKERQEFNEIKISTQQIVEQLITENRQVSDKNEILQQLTERQSRHLSRLHDIIQPVVLSTSRCRTFSHVEPLLTIGENMQGEHTRRRSVSLGG